MSEERYKNDKWDIIVHARGGGRPPFQYPYTGPEPSSGDDGNVYLMDYWTEWTLNGYRCPRKYWLKDSLSLAGCVPQPNGGEWSEEDWDKEGEFAIREPNGRVHTLSLPAGVSQDELLQEAWFGEMWEYIKQQRPPQPSRPQ